MAGAAARRRIILERQDDFTGGLNLKDSLYSLQPNETFDCQNVDFDRRGGFGIRRGSKAFITTPHRRVITATGASRTANVVTATGLSPVNGDATGGLKVGQQITVDFADNTYDGTFIVTGAVNGASTATWAQVAADDVSAGAGTIVEGFTAADSGYTYVDTSLNRHILVARGGWVKRWDGTFWQDVQVNASSGRTVFAEMNNVLYMLRPGRVEPSTWTGTGTATNLVTAVGNYNDDLTAPNGGNFPPCVTMCVHHEVMWAANVKDTGATVNRTRIRWSHPAQPEDWRTNDFIDIDADDENGEIRALVPFGDRLLVFKDKAVYAVHGYPPAGFSVQPLTKQLGTPSQWSVSATEDAVYFWDQDKGLWKYDGTNFTWVFEPLWPLIEDNKINMPFSYQVIVQFHNKRVWLSVPFLAPPYQNKFISLVYAPDAGERGAWTIHTRTLFGWWVHRGSVGGDLHLLGGDTPNASGYLMELDVENLYTDQFGVATPVFIKAWYTTRWFFANNIAMKKRWKRPVMLMRGGAEQRTIVQVLTDFDPTHVTKTFDVFTTLDGTEGVWDVDDWDVATWAAETTLGADRGVLVRGAPLAGGVAKALRFTNTDLGQDWRLYGLTMKWIPRAIRN